MPSVTKGAEDSVGSEPASKRKSHICLHSVDSIGPESPMRDARALGIDAGVNR